MIALLLLVSHRLVLDQSVLQQRSESHALISIRLHLVFTLTMLTHLDILLELFNLTILHLHLKFHLAVLTLQLLHQERLQVISLLSDRHLSTSMQKVGLLLQLSGQVLDVLLFLLQIDIHLLGLSAEACVLITSNVILNLQVAVHIANFLLFSWAEDWGLVSL